MNKKVQKAEVSINVAVGSNSPVRPSAAAGLGALPNPDDLRLKYGLPAPAEAKGGTDVGGGDRGDSGTVQTLAKAVETLQAKLEDKNRKIEQLCILLEALEPMPGVNAERLKHALDSAQDSELVDLRDSKIVSLAKKSHNLTMQLNKERSTVERLRKELDEEQRRSKALADELALQRSVAATTKSDQKVYNRNALAAQAKKEEEEASQADLARSLSDAQRSIEDLKRKNKELADENKHLSRSLAKELGDSDGSIDTTYDPSWRGRAQHIVMLKAKVKALEGQLGATASAGTLRSVDAKAEEGLQEMSRERRQVVEALTEERVRLIEQVQSLEKKSGAYKARIQTLEAEARRLKENLQVALDKSQTDDQLLEALKEEVQRLHSKRKQMGASAQATGGTRSNTGSDELLQKQEQLESEIRRLQRLVRNQTEQLDAQDVTIRELRKKLAS